MVFYILVSPEEDPRRDRTDRTTTEILLKTLTPEQLAERWQLSSNTLANWRSQGIGPVYLRLGARVAYRVDDVEAFEQRSLHQSPSLRAGEAA